MDIGGREKKRLKRKTALHERGTPSYLTVSLTVPVTAETEETLFYSPGHT